MAHRVPKVRRVPKEAPEALAQLAQQEPLAQRVPLVQRVLKDRPGLLAALVPLGPRAVKETLALPALQEVRAPKAQRALLV